ncbi:MAG TPA: hybrid sensor histidine kinase/response regulator [Burkholderiales bacterium]|nr:hybrid sensor histidine kinase/response regulator [Burkholderiales bacterium]
MPHRILHVDDTPASLYARTRLLQRSGYEVVEATNGRDALDKVANAGAELMLIDVNLPDMSGLDVCQRVKTDPLTRELPVVQISAARVSDLDAAQAVSSGADFYVTEPVRDESLLLVIRSLLARRQVRQQFQHTVVRDVLKRERESRRASRDTLATLGHELRDPLRAMTTWLSVLRDPHLPHEDRERALQRIQRAVELQAGIVSDLLDVARMNDGTLSAELAPMSLEHAVIETIEAMQPAIVDKNIRVRLNSDGAVWIQGDSARIGQVATNLLANAIRFAAVGGNVEVSCRLARGEAELRVADDGEGIAAELLPHVFEPFRQAQRTGTEPQAGLGLGLAIAAHIVREHNGRISVTSPGRGKGATVVAHFPAISPR